MKKQTHIARTLSGQHARDLQRAGIRFHAKSWGGRPTAKQDRMKWKRQRTVG